jgi:hypothetical protein
MYFNPPGRNLEEVARIQHVLAGVVPLRLQYATKQALADNSSQGHSPLGHDQLASSTSLKRGARKSDPRHCKKETPAFHNAGAFTRMCIYEREETNYWIS